MGSRAVRVASDVVPVSDSVCCSETQTLPLRDLEEDAPSLLGRHESGSEDPQGHALQGFRADVFVSPLAVFKVRSLCAGGCCRITTDVVTRLAPARSARKTLHAHCVWDA